MSAGVKKTVSARIHPTAFWINRDLPWYATVLSRRPLVQERKARSPSYSSLVAIVYVAQVTTKCFI